MKVTHLFLASTFAAIAFAAYPTVFFAKVDNNYYPLVSTDLPIGEDNRSLNVLFYEDNNNYGEPIDFTIENDGAFSDNGPAGFYDQLLSHGSGINAQTLGLVDGQVTFSTFQSCYLYNSASRGIFIDPGKSQISNRNCINVELYFLPYDSETRQPAEEDEEGSSSIVASSSSSSTSSDAPSSSSSASSSVEPESSSATSDVSEPPSSSSAAPESSVSDNPDASSNSEPPVSSESAASSIPLVLESGVSSSTEASESAVSTIAEASASSSSDPVSVINTIAAVSSGISGVFNSTTPVAAGTLATETLAADPVVSNSSSVNGWNVTSATRETTTISTYCPKCEHAPGDTVWKTYTDYTTYCPYETTLTITKCDIVCHPTTITVTAPTTLTVAGVCIVPETVTAGGSTPKNPGQNNAGGDSAPKPDKPSPKAPAETAAAGNVAANPKSSSVLNQGSGQTVAAVPTVAPLANAGSRTAIGGFILGFAALLL